MRISTRLTLAALVPAIMAVIMAIGLFVSYRSVSDWQVQQERATRISADVSELTDLARVYVLDHEDRPKRQFLIKHADATKLVKQASPDGEAQRKRLDALSTDLELAGSLFQRLAANAEAGGEASDPLFAAAEQRLSGQLFIRLRGANSSAAELAELISADIVAYQQRYSVVTTGLTALVALALTAALLAMIISITRGLAVLTTGTERIGAGDLSHRIGLKRKDELGELGSSFDRMSAQLRKLIVSRAELEREVAARVEAQAQEQRGALLSSTLAEISASLAAMQNLEDELLRTLRKASDVLGAAGAVLADRIEGGWLTRESYGLPVERVGEFHPDERSGGRARILRTREIYFVPEVEDHPVDDTVRTARLGFRSYVIAPLLYRAEIVGALTFYFIEPRPSLSGRETNFLSRLAYIVTVSLENARLLRAERDARREAHRELETTSLLLEAASNLARWTDVRGSLQQLAEIIHDSTSHSRTTVLLWDEETAQLEIVATAGAEALGDQGRRLPVDALPPAARELLERRQPGRFDAEGPAIRGDGANVAGGSSMYLAPIVLSERLFGLILVDDPGERWEFARRETEVIGAIAAQAAVALENARLYETEHDIAERLQSAMLAMPDEVPGLRFDHEYRSASESARVGGDFYDLFEIDDTLVGITMGDIAGKGLSAAVLTSLVKNSVRAHATEKGSTPGDILSLTNEVVYRGTGNDAFATVLFAVLNRETGCLEYSNAGHTTAFILRPDAEPLPLGPTGPILGAFKDVRFSQSEVPCLRTGDMLFLYTDGVIEARAGSQLYGEERLLHVLVKAAREPRPAIEAVLEDMLGFTGGPLSDDVAMLAVSVVKEVTALP